MPKFNIGDTITIRLTQPKGQTFPSGAAAQILFQGQRTGTTLTWTATISSNTTTLACMDYTLIGNEALVPDSYEAQGLYTAPGGVSISSTRPHPVWDVEARL